MATTVDSLLVSFDNQVSAGAAAAAASLDKFTAASNAAAAAATTTDTTVTRTTRSWQSWAASGVDPAAQAAARIEKAQRDAAASTLALNQALAAGGVSAAGFVQQQANIAATLAQRTQAAQTAADRQTALRQADDAGTTSTGALTKAQSDLTASHGAVASATRNTTVQFVQFASQLATGQPLMLAAIEQGHQLVDVMMTSGQGVSSLLSPLKSLAAGIVTPTGAALALVGGLGALALAADSQSSHLIDLQQNLRATSTNYVSLANDVEAAAKKVAASSNLSTADAESAAKIVASTQAFQAYGGSIEDVTRLSGDLARMLGVSVTEAAKDVATAYADPTKAAQDFAAQGLTAINVASLQTIQRLQAQGSSAAATAIVIKLLQDAYSGAGDKASQIDAAWHRLEQTFTSTDASGQRLGTTIGGFLAGQVAGFIDDINHLVQSLEQVYNLAQKAASSLAPRTGVAPSSAVLQGPGSSIGLFQLTNAARSDVTRQYGYTPDAYSLQGNAEAGAMYLNMVGSPGAFHLGVQGAQDDPAGAAAYTAKVAAQDPANLDAAVSAAIDKAAAAYAPGLAETLKRIALVESSGQQFGVSATDVANVSTARAASASPDSAASRYSAAIPFSVTSALGSTDTTTLSAQQAASDAVQKYRQALDDLNASGTHSGPVFDELTARLQKAQGVLNDSLTPAQQYVRSLQDQATASTGLYEGDSKLIEVRQHLDELNRSLPGSVTPTVQAAAETAALADQSNAYRKLQADSALTIQSQTAVATAYGQGSDAVLQATASTSAYSQALKLFPAGSEAARVAQQGLTQSNLDLARSAATLQTAQQNAQSRDNLDYIAAETSSLGENEAQREKLLATLKAEQQMHEKFKGDLPQEAKDYIDLAGRVSDATSAYQQQQASLQELSGFATQTFDTISQSIASAFADGSLKAVDFGNVVKSVMSSIVSEIAKLAILNPALNALFGQNNPTLGSVGGVIGNLLGNGSSTSSGAAALLGLGGSGAASSGGIFGNNATQGAANDNSTGLLGGGSGVLGSNISGSDLLSGLTTVAAIGSLAAGKSSGISGSQVLSLANYAYKAAAYEFPQTTASLTSGVTNTLSYGYNSVGTSLGLLDASGDGVSTAAATAGQTVSIAAADDFASATGTAATAASSLANALPLLGVAISVVTDLVQGNLRGAAFVATGAAVGAEVGTDVFPGIGTAIGAAIGAVVGGLVDTFFPQHAKNPYANTEIDVTDGHLTQGNTVSQLIDTSGTQQAVDQFNTQFNAFLDSLNLTITNANGVVGNIGQNIKGITQITSPDHVLGALTFGSTDTTSNFGIAAGGALAGEHFATIDQFTGYLQGIATFADQMTGIGIQLASVAPNLKNIQIASITNPNADGSQSALYTAFSHDLPGQVFADQNALDAELQRVNQFVNGTMPSLINPTLQHTESDVQKGLDALQAQYGNAIQQAEAFGLSIDGLAQGFQTAVAQYLAPAIQSITEETGSIVARGYAATGDQKTADLMNYDIQAEKERTQYTSDLENVWGATFTTTAEYGVLMNQLETVQGEERAAIVQKYATAATQALQQALSAAQASVSSVVSGILNYTNQLETGSNSPLSPMAQYQLAASQFSSTASAAATGDITAAGNLTSYADSFLSASQAVYGSGAQYAADFQTVLDALGSATSNSDALVNSALLAATQDNTTKLSDLLGQVRDQLVALNTSVTQGGLRPLRAAA